MQIDNWSHSYIFILNIPIINCTKVNSKNYPTKEFMAMFMGLIDGDGYIEIGEQKQYHKKLNY